MNLKRITAMMKWVSIFILVMGMAACSEKPDPNLPNTLSSNITFDVFKSPTCGCCEQWIEHMENAGFGIETHDSMNLAQVKSEYGISPAYRSCHTAVSKEGYVFEGHIPAKLIQKFLDEKPQDVIGLSVPGMPAGSPGMEVGDRFIPYQVLLLKKDGSTEVYVEVHSYEEQF